MRPPLFADEHDLSGNLQDAALTAQPFRRELMTTLTAIEPQTLRVRLGDPRLLTEMLTESDALEHGHFELLSGHHAETFIRFSRSAKHSPSLETTARWLLPSVAAWLPEVVLAPATAGVSLAWTISRQLGLPLVLADVGDDGRALPLAQAENVANKRVLLVNDVVTTGTGMEVLASVARDAGAVVAGGTWFLARNDVDVAAMIDAPTSSVGDLPLKQWSRQACPLCDRGDDLTRALEIN